MGGGAAWEAGVIGDFDAAAVGDEARFDVEGEGALVVAGAGVDEEA